MRDEPVPPVTNSEVDEAYEVFRPADVLDCLPDARQRGRGGGCRCTGGRTCATIALTTQGIAIESPKAFLATVTTRLAIDALRSARAKHEAYIRVWLPEPLAASLEPDRRNTPR